MKSIPLMLQEVLEGSVFSVLIITLIARLGENVISSYSISMRIVSLCLLPMYMYCNSLTVLVGEYQSKKEYLKMKILPITTIVTTISVYVIISVLSYIYKENLIGTLTNINSVQEGTIQMLKTVLLFSVFQILFENSKYVLQSIGKSKEALKTTVVINSLASIILIALNIYNLLDLKIVLGILALNYLILSVFFFRRVLKRSKEVFCFVAAELTKNVNILVV
ncbi:MAG: MATE family efflux transporter [Peptoanaerobacter stomatis]|uniref:MATE family efflux transporter n=1 Tax=Peptoanaerobacter stomatis TaxID=796937 RepID=UPI003FA07009